MISDWCAKLYQIFDFIGWELVVGETGHLDLNGKYNDEVSSARVNSGCTLKLYRSFNTHIRLYTLTADAPSLNAYDDQVSSLLCYCQGIKTKHFSSKLHKMPIATNLSLFQSF